MNTSVSHIPATLRDRSNIDLRSGDTVRVHLKVQEKSGSTRIQTFEGLVLARKHGSEAGGTFTVRKISHGIGVERVFPLYSPVIDSIEVVRRSRARRSKLYYIRTKVARDIRRKMRNFMDFIKFVPTPVVVPSADTTIAESVDVVAE